MRSAMVAVLEEMNEVDEQRSAGTTMLAQTLAQVHEMVIAAASANDLTHAAHV